MLDIVLILLFIIEFVIRIIHIEIILQYIKLRIFTN